jgi:hypothetical protein
MLRSIILAGLLSITAIPAVAAEASAPAYSVESTTIGDLLDNAAAKAVLDKHLPGFSTNPQIEMARTMTLKQVQGFAPDQFKDELLAKINADLAALPAK